MDEPLSDEDLAIELVQMLRDRYFGPEGGALIETGGGQIDPRDVGVDGGIDFLEIVSYVRDRTGYQ